MDTECDEKLSFGGFNVPINSFSKFIVKTRFHPSFCNRLESFLQPETFCSLKELELCTESITPNQIKCIQSILGVIEVVEDLYGSLLQYCSKLKHLIYALHHAGTGFDTTWLTRKYPTLESLVLYVKVPNVILELGIFLQQNPTVTCLGLHASVLWMNRKSFINSGIQLNRLILDVMGSVCNDLFNNYIDLLKQLYENGFYKKLQLHMGSSERYLQPIINQTCLVYALDVRDIYEPVGLCSFFIHLK